MTMIAQHQEPISALLSLGPFVRDYGGWGVLVLFLAVLSWAVGRAAIAGGRAFMALAQKFSADVVTELKEIKTAIQGQERRVDNLTEKVDQVDEKVGEQGKRIEQLNVLVSAQHCKGGG